MSTQTTRNSDAALLRKARAHTDMTKTPITPQGGVQIPPQTPLRSATESSSIIAVAANSDMVLQGLTRYLKASHFQAVAAITSLSDLTSLVSEIHPAMVIIETSSQSMEGFEAIGAIRRINPAIKILVLADYTMPSLVRMIFRSGAHGYLLSMPTQATMLKALDIIKNGENVLDKQLEYIRPTLSNTLTSACITV
jgi:DNA-binding NarL/FixJ family response regulator